MKKTIKLFNNLFLILALIAISAGIWHYKPALTNKFFQSEDFTRNLYKEARLLQSNQDFSSAYYTYSKISKYYKMYDIVLYQQASCAVAIEDEKTAIAKYESILKSYPKSPVASLASYNLGQAYLRIKADLQAEKQFLNTIKNYPDTDYAIGSFYYLGELNKNKNKEIAAQYWLKYIATAPSGKFALNSYYGLRDLNYAFNQTDKKRIGIVFFMRQNYRKALEYFNQLPQKEIWHYSAMCHKVLGNKQTSFSILKNGLRYYLDEKTDRSKIEKAMLSYVELNNSEQKTSWSDILSWTNIAKDFALYHKAQLLPFEEAKKLYEQIYSKYPESNYASESLWRLFWHAYDKGDYKNALSLGKKHLDSYENKKASPAVYFWMGKIFEKYENFSTAENFYNATLKKFPDSYYAFRANGRLNEIKGRSDNQWLTNRNNLLPVEEKKMETPYSYGEISEKYGIQAAELIYLEDYDTALMIMPEKDPFLESWIKLQKNLITGSIVVARNEMESIASKPETRDNKWKLIYPVYYAEEINQNALIYDIDPILILSLMKEESHFNQFAVSSSNARGLMQVLPQTASDIIRWKNLSDCTPNELFNPKTNIKVGATYLEYTGEMFDRNMLFAVASYNAGPGAVQTWLKRYPDEDLDRFVENIPYSQTKNYVKKVFGSYWNYKRIYGFE
ncbi:MAG TPA: transglycosylase SLT domain-containing protein [Candidatus Gastranaerophilales bacterium]|nr:transglycosylase SLT domain-containing protein [Candidatus Gastranaerophilales bacterium]